MGKLLTTILLGASLFGFGCAEKINGPETKQLEVIESKTRSYRNYFDTQDVVFDDAVKERLAVVEKKYSDFEVSLNTQDFKGKKYILGFSIYGKCINEPPNYINLRSDFNFVAGDFNYMELPRGNIFDGVDVPESPELLKRLEEMNKSRKDISFLPIYLEDKSERIIVSDKGEKMINGIYIYAKVSENAGSSSDRDEILYIMTGENKPQGQGIKIDSLKIKKLKIDSLKIPFID